MKDKIRKKSKNKILANSGDKIRKIKIIDLMIKLKTN